MSMQTINKSIKKNSVLGLLDKPLCLPSGKRSSCSLAKSTHHPVNSPLRQIADAPGSVVAVELVGPFPVALDGSTYGLIVHDIFSRLTSSIGSKCKDQGAGKVVSWIENFKKHCSHDVLCIRSDCGGEFSSKKFNDYLKACTILHELLVPYKHHQKGSVECTNRSLLKMAFTLLIHAKIPTSLWFLALKQATFIFNRMVYDKEIKTPFKLCLGKTPSLEIVRVLIGCCVYLHNNRYLKQFVPRSLPLIHVGISNNLHGWLRWNPVSKKIEVGASVIFHKD